MRRLSFHYFPRDLDSDNLIENFLVSAIASVLIIRVFLHLTKFPIIGGEEFHVAHMLWGGFLMMASLIGLLVFLNKETKYIASIIGGIGFGTFIDELGKFLTKDNNYFYQPTIALIYVIFVLIFLGARAIEKYFRPTDLEYAVNALEMTKQVLMHDLDVEEKKRAEYFLKRSDQNNPVVRMLSQSLSQAEAIPISKPNLFHNVRNFVTKNYLVITRSERFSRLIVLFFVLASFINLLNALYNFGSVQTFSDWGQLIFSVLSGVLVIIGVYMLRVLKSARQAFEFFRYAVLVSIFLTQFFRFLEEQLSAVYGLFLSLIILSVLQYLIYQENLRIKED